MMREEKLFSAIHIAGTAMAIAFTMVMAVDVSQATVSFTEIRDSLAELGKDMNLSIRIQREEIFDAMHII